MERDVSEKARFVVVEVAYHFDVVMVVVLGLESSFLGEN